LIEKAVKEQSMIISNDRRRAKGKVTNLELFIEALRHVTKPRQVKLAKLRMKIMDGMARSSTNHMEMASTVKDQVKAGSTMISNGHRPTWERMTLTNHQAMNPHDITTLTLQIESVNQMTMAKDEVMIGATIKSGGDHLKRKGKMPKSMNQMKIATMINDDEVTGSTVIGDYQTRKEATTLSRAITTHMEMASIVKDKVRIEATMMSNGDRHLTMDPHATTTLPLQIESINHLAMESMVKDEVMIETTILKLLLLDTPPSLRITIGIGRMTNQGEVVTGSTMIDVEVLIRIAKASTSTMKSEVVKKAKKAKEPTLRQLLLIEITNQHHAIHPHAIAPLTLQSTNIWTMAHHEITIVHTGVITQETNLSVCKRFQPVPLSNSADRHQYDRRSYL
jgi:hypothetical protein